jgi:predicted ATPase
MGPHPTIESITIEGFRPFGRFSAKLEPLQVIVGANATGKSSLFEFLRFLREATTGRIPPEIIEGSIGREVFHRPGSDRITWDLFVTQSPGRYPGLRFRG